jgi:hypothetical protein
VPLARRMYQPGIPITPSVSEARPRQAGSRCSGLRFASVAAMRQPRLPLRIAHAAYSLKWIPPPEHLSGNYPPKFRRGVIRMKVNLFSMNYCHLICSNLPFLNTNFSIRIGWSFSSRKYMVAIRFFSSKST